MTFQTTSFFLLVLTAAAPASAGDRPASAPATRPASAELSFDDQWTPKGHLGKGDLPREKEADWIDDRIRRSDTGPFFTTSLIVPDITRPRQPFIDRLTPVDDRSAVPGDDRVIKALAIRLGGGADGAPRAGVLFDKEKMTLRCGWTGGYLDHSALRFGLLEAPRIGGDLAFASVPDAWQRDDDGNDAAAPLSREWKGLYRHGNDVVLAYTIDGRSVRELNTLEPAGAGWAFARTLEIGPGQTPLAVTLAKLPDASPKDVKVGVMIATNDSAVVATATGAAVAAMDDRLILKLPARDETTRVSVRLQSGKPPALLPTVPEAPADLAPLTGGGPRVWGEPLVTRGALGKPKNGSPLVVDTITIPTDNPHNALFFIGGFDFAPDGTCYVAAAHGDVWRVSGIDDDLAEVRWQRIATGLYQPLGLKVRDGEVFVLGRDQVTRLHDLNGDGETDFYENFNDDCTDHGQPHAYAMCLETDLDGNFFFLKSGAPKTPHGGTLLKLSADGRKLDVYATGFRHANGLGIGPDGTITTADNEGNWTPVTRVDIVAPGGFYGHVPTAHLDVEPTDPGRPLCWLPRAVDNSAGGQAWVPQDSWGSLGGSLLHFSYGRCTANVILKENVDGVWQGGAVLLPTKPFLSGVHRGRFRTAGDGADGHLYVCGLNGWSSEAPQDGCLQRVRYVGGAVPLPTGLHVYENGIELTFAEPLDATLAADPGHYAVDIWTYRWSKEYGSKDYRHDDPQREGRANLKVTAATPSDDGRSVFITVEGLTPVMQLRVQAGLRSVRGTALPVDYYGTIHRLRPAR